ncbi:MAG: hypothetical protein FWD26_09370 [Treponema sp.]|nr:hypothetical protein [Treponema sp.]
MPIIEEDMSFITFILLVLLNISPISSLDLPAARISDDSILRNNLRQAWFLDTPRMVLSQHTRIEHLETGERVQVSATEGRDEFIVVLSRERMSAAERRPTGQFPGWAQGSWMLTRNKETGAGTLIRIFLRSDQFTYIQFRPFDTEKCMMDAVLYGGYIVSSVPIPVPPPLPGTTPSINNAFERLYTMPLNDILKLVEGKFPLKYFEPDPSLYRDSRTLVTQIRSQIGALRFADDGAIDENGNYVFINTLEPQRPAAAGLNCSGFAKWLIDGILRPVTGKRLPIPPLKEPFGERGSSFTVNWEERRDVFFGLDWIRNLAAEANGTLRSAPYRALEEFEIRRNTFSSIMINENRNIVVNSYPGFMHEAGYTMEGLRPLLYTLAIDEPYSFYLAAINTEISTPTSIRGTPRLRQYFHIAALIPYFDELGVFRIAVFESATETSSFIAFRNRYPGHFVNLVKIPVSARFEP